jgi:hypothetical protein
MPLRLLAGRQRAGAYAGRLFFLGSMQGFWFFVIQFLPGVRGYGPLETGFAFLPTTLANVAVALAVPRLTRRFGNARLLAGALLGAVIGMAWLGQVSADSPFLTGIALPTVLSGIGPGGARAPRTSAGIAGVAPEDAGAASGLVNVAHQLGGSLGLGILVTVFAAGSNSLDARDGLAHQVATALTAGAVMLALALAVVVALIVRPRTAAEVGAGSVSV